MNWYKYSLWDSMAPFSFSNHIFTHPQPHPHMHPHAHTHARTQTHKHTHTHSAPSALCGFINNTDRSEWRFYWTIRWGRRVYHTPYSRVQVRCGSGQSSVCLETLWRGAGAVRTAENTSFGVGVKVRTSCTKAKVKVCCMDLCVEYVVVVLRIILLWFFLSKGISLVCGVFCLFLIDLFWMELRMFAT